VENLPEVKNLAKGERAQWKASSERCNENKYEILSS